MSPRYRYLIRPLDGGFSSDWSSLHAPPGTIVYPSKNIRIEQHRAKKRWGYATDRALGAGVSVLGVAIYQQTGATGTRNTMYLTDTDLCRKEETDTNATWSYKTETYTTGLVTDVTGAVVTGDTDCAWDTSGLAAGDKFIVNSDHDADSEPDANWATIASVDSATQITLSASYTGVGTGAYKGRMVYSTPANELPWYTVVSNKFCFGNGNIDVQYWSGSNYATALNSTSAKKARYGIEYANRLVLADLDVSAVRDQMTIWWSKEGDPTDWTATTAGNAQLLQSPGYITGLGKIGASLVVYKEDMIELWDRTGVATEPIHRSTYRIGEGMIAPYSLIQAFYTNYFLGETDFYKIVGDYPVSIGEPIRDFFFENVTRSNAQKTIGFAVEQTHELVWLATTTSYGQLAFVYNLRSGRWYVYDFAATLTGAGRGATT